MIHIGLEITMCIGLIIVYSYAVHILISSLFFSILIVIVSAVFFIDIDKRLFNWLMYHNEMTVRGRRHFRNT